MLEVLLDDMMATCATANACLEARNLAATIQKEFVSGDRFMLIERP